LRWAAIKKTQIIDFIKKNIVYDKSIIKDLSPRLAETELFLATALDIFLDYMENANVNINMRDVKDASEVSDLQEMLNIGRNSAYNLIRENKIKHFKVGKSIKIPKIYIIEFMQSICANQQTSA
jgi:excisionase family DNA binding protein